MKRKFDKSAPRYQAGSMKLPDGAGEITTLCACGDFLEIFTENSSYRVKTPESVDPEETNPNAPWVTSKSSDFGSSNKVVARVLLQSTEMMKTAMIKKDTVNKDKVLKLVYECKDALLICEKIKNRISVEAENIEIKLNSDGLDIDGRGMHINSFPQIPDLDEDVTNFLINIKRAIGKICYLANEFLPLIRKNNNLDHLIKHIGELKNDEHNQLIDFLHNYKTGVKHLIDLRNYQEHPGEKTTHIENYKIMPDGKINTPAWYVTGEEPGSLVDEMRSAIDFIIVLHETMLVHLIFICMDSVVPFFIEETPDEKIDKKIPIKYRLSIDISQLKFDK